MDGDVLTVSLVSLWMGFAVALQVRTQIKFDAQVRGGIGWRLMVARLIHFAVGILGLLGIASLIGDFRIFRGAVFPICFGLGIAAFFAASGLSEPKDAGS